MQQDNVAKLSFQDRVGTCPSRHINEPRNLSPTYSAMIVCSTPYCSGHEVRCQDCGVYISKCGCGSENGMSGWPHKRWRKHQ